MAALQALADTYEAGRLLREGLLVVIAGRPNVGKSSLLNRLLDLDRAIVTEIPGTTRDLIEETITLGGVLVRFSDTAGLRPAQDRLEELGIRRTRERLAQADLVLYLVDGSATPAAPRTGRPWRNWRGRRGLVVINKMDLPRRSTPSRFDRGHRLPGGADFRPHRGGDRGPETGHGGPGPGGRPQGQRRDGHPGPASSASRKCLASLSQARALLAADRHAPAWELVALELQEAIRELGEITGQEVGDEVLERIFGEFCLGK